MKKDYYFNNFNDKNIIEIKEILDFLLFSKAPPKKTIFKQILNEVVSVLNNESKTIRPYDDDDKPGGLIYLKKYKNVLILPDLHARRDFFSKILKWEINNISVIDYLDKQELSILCLGDGVHSEGHQIKRWIKAHEEFKNSYKEHEYIDKEIADSFNLMIAIMILKIRFKNNFHFLKGNHENIMNETKNGNYSFTKFCNEGMMIYKYFKKFYQKETLLLYDLFEKSLPLFAIGNYFLASHAEPEYGFNKNSIINYRRDPNLIEALTWTNDNVDNKGAVKFLLNKFLRNKKENAFYFGGHRPINLLYKMKKNTNYVKIHNPNMQVFVYIDQSKKINLEDDIYAL